MCDLSEKFSLLLKISFQISKQSEDKTIYN